MRDVIIIGGGISAHTAAIYTARAQLKPLVLAGETPDQLSYTTDVENFPGFPEGIAGPMLVMNAKKQAQRFGAEYKQERVTNLERKGDDFIISTPKEKYDAKTVIIATGASARMLGIPGEEKFFGKGVSSCAVCDAAFYQDKTAIVIGGGDSAMEEALALYKFCKKVIIVHRRDQLRASKIMQDRVLKLSDKISVMWDTLPLEVIGDEEGRKVIGLKVKNVKTEEEKIVDTDGVFLAIGHIPNTDAFKDVVKTDDHGYIITDKANTNLAGVYAAGDVQDTIFKQAITSAATGCMAALRAEKYIEEKKAKGEY
ncbi:thioredoxin-disulfide reductase [Candidatus Woesearchaeota archaeon]|nr:thioredoxin-disulfide reductase [Candidatus Woesearchaeota archaeon]